MDCDMTISSPSATGITRPADADNTRFQPSDDKGDQSCDKLGSDDAGMGETCSTKDAVDRAERGSRNVDAPRRGAPPGIR
jgi:hypothetical protein